MEKQTLSDKEQALGTLAGASYGTKIYYPEDVKDFIKKLKEEWKLEMPYSSFKSFVDKLAGDKLI